jgi:DNA-binding beta-propeller fold protein YncE
VSEAELAGVSRTRVVDTEQAKTTPSRIDTATNQVVGPPIAVGEGPVGIAFTPDDRAACVANTESHTR